MIYPSFSKSKIFLLIGISALFSNCAADDSATTASQAKTALVRPPQEISEPANSLALSENGAGGNTHSQPSPKPQVLNPEATPGYAFSNDIYGNSLTDEQKDVYKQLYEELKKSGLLNHFDSQGARPTALINNKATQRVDNASGAHILEIILKPKAHPTSNVISLFARGNYPGTFVTTDQSTQNMPHQDYVKYANLEKDWASYHALYNFEYQLDVQKLREKMPLRSLAFSFFGATSNNPNNGNTQLNFYQTDNDPVTGLPAPAAIAEKNGKATIINYRNGGIKSYAADGVIKISEQMIPPELLNGAIESVLRAPPDVLARLTEEDAARLKSYLETLDDVNAKVRLDAVTWLDNAKMNNESNTRVAAANKAYDAVSKTGSLTSETQSYIEAVKPSAPSLTAPGYQEKTVTSTAPVKTTPVAAAPTVATRNVATPGTKAGTITNALSGNVGAIYNAATGKDGAKIDNAINAAGIAVDAGLAYWAAPTATQGLLAAGGSVVAGAGIIGGGLLGAKVGEQVNYTLGIDNNSYFGNANKTTFGIGGAAIGGGLATTGYSVLGGTTLQGGALAAGAGVAGTVAAAGAVGAVSFAVGYAGGQKFVDNYGTAIENQYYAKEKAYLASGFKAGQSVNCSCQTKTCTPGGLMGLFGDSCKEGGSSSFVVPDLLSCNMQNGQKFSVSVNGKSSYTMRYNCSAK